MVTGNGKYEEAQAADKEVATATTETAVEKAPEASVQSVKSAAATTEAATAPQDNATAETAEVAAASATEAATDETAQQATSAADLLRAAREAYWSNDYARSEGFYKELLAIEDLPEHKGELANVYWKANKANEAADLYLEIAPWLSSQGRIEELVNIKLYMDMVDPAKAKQLLDVAKIKQ